MVRLLWLTVMIPSATFAFVPDYHTILSRTADSHGRGIYEVEQDVIFPTDPEPLSVKETWLIAGESQLSVRLEGTGSLKGLIGGEIIFDQQRRHFLNEQRQVQSQSLSDSWWMPFFHFRYSKPMRSRMVALKMVPAASLSPRKVTPPTKGKSLDFIYEEQDFLRLSRSGGAVAYAIGTPSSPDGKVTPPGLWIEQDQFVVRKLRLPSQTEVSADQYSRYPLGLWLPRTMQIRWGDRSAQVHVSRVRSLGTSKAKANDLSPKSLASRKTVAPLKLPEDQAIKEFYTLFR